MVRVQRYFSRLSGSSPQPVADGFVARQIHLSLHLGRDRTSCSPGHRRYCHTSELSLCLYWRVRVAVCGTTTTSPEPADRSAPLACIVNGAITTSPEPTM